MVIPPGVLVNVHVPDAGKPLKSTLPVAIVHVGCIIVPTTGAIGVASSALITTLADATEIQLDALVTVMIILARLMSARFVLVVISSRGFALRSSSFNDSNGAFLFS